MRKELSYVMLESHNVRMEQSNVKKKVREPLNVKKKIVTYDIRTAQCENRIVKCEKKVRETTKCEKRTVTCDVGTA